MTILKEMNLIQELDWVEICSLDDIIPNTGVGAIIGNQQIALLPINYSLQEKRATNELVIAPHRMRLPRTMRIGAKKFEFKEITPRNAA